jgi:hypothetical protein
MMEVDAILCNHAEAAENKLYVSGGGINIAWVPPEPPHLVHVALGGVVQVPYTATNQPHSLVVRLIDEDGQAVTPWTPEGSDTPPPVEIQTGFNFGRPPQLPHGEDQAFPFAMKFQLAVPHVGAYAFVIEIDGTEMRRLHLRATVPPAGMVGL